MMLFVVFVVSDDTFADAVNDIVNIVDVVDVINVVYFVM